MNPPPFSTQVAEVAPAVPEQRRRGHGGCVPGDRIVRQVHGIDAWCAALTSRQELLLGPGGSRNGRLNGARRLDVLHRAQEALVAMTARGLARDPSPTQYGARTAVVAHSHPWFRDRVCALLTAHGLEIVVCTDNGADALGAIIAEQCDLVIVGDRLAMMTGVDLLAEATLFSPSSVRIVQGDGERSVDLLAAGAHAVLPRSVPAAALVERVAHLLALAAAGLGVMS